MAEPDPSRAAAPDRADFWREPIRGGHPDPHQLTLPGIEQLRLQMRDASPEAPLSRLTGMRLREVSPGQAVFTMPLTGWLAGADGAVPPGPLSIPADAAMACAIMSELPPGTPFTTSEMTLRVLRPVPPGGEVTASGRVLFSGPPVELAEVAVHDAAGKLIAHGSSVCMRLPAIAPPRANGDDGRGDIPATPDPWERPAPEVPALSAERSGIEQLEARIADTAPASPLERFTGLTPLEAGRGEALYGLAASPWFCAPPPGRLQGGVIITLIEAAMFGAVRTELPAAHPVHPVELKVNLLRPLASDDRVARARGTVMHAGRRLAVVRGELSDADGRAIAVATGSALLGGPAAGER